ncbi:NADP-dependent oxidoreductase domain-containing protein [Tricladium varicosporioides]|nr:NADP-dependent oxidoreductase domain-containing protein [Hymenoscyphus varicosporioides]
MSTLLSQKTLVALAVGTHTWAPTPESEGTQDEVVAILRKHGITILDTARSYGMGASEETIGNKNLGAEFTIVTKAPTGLGGGAGKRENILREGRKSNEVLRLRKIPVYLLHAPDESVPVAETLGAIQTLYEEGRFERFGLSNMSRDQVLEHYNYAKSRNFILPTVYQASYSPAVRGIETALVPTLRELGISIQAYSPLASGFLSKTVEQIENGHGTERWDPNSVYGMISRHLFYKPSYMKMLTEYGKLSEESGVSRAGLAYRWVRYHSALRGELGDEMIIGANSAKQFREAVVEIEKGPLEQWMVERIDGLWELVKDDAPIDNLRAVRDVIGGLSK